MEIVRYANVHYLSILGEAPVYENKVYRLSKCLLMTDVDEGVLILNGLTRAIVILNKDDLKNLGNIKKYIFLYKTYFMVPEDFDELLEIDNIRKKSSLPIDSLYLDQCNNYTILTTYGCNARCGYCYEKNTPKKTPMSEETALNIVDYVCNKANKQNEINLHWFGGEPLVNAKIIDIITRELRDRGFKFVSTMTSNGYLFDEKMVTKAVNSWNLKSVQITLDGTEKIYNKIKNYVYSNTNAFKRVFNNIKLLLDNNVGVSIRLNISDKNKKDLYKLIDVIYDTFGVRSGLEIYCWPLFLTEDVDRPIEDESNIYEWVDKIENKFIKLGFPYGKNISEFIRNSQCMADSGSSILISPNGDLGTCEHLIDSKFWGHINDINKKDYNILNTWRNYESRISECDNCPIYAECVRPSECLEMKRCNKFIQGHKIKQYIKGLENFYLNWKMYECNKTSKS